MSIYLINNWYMEHCHICSEMGLGQEENFYLVKGDYVDHPFIKNDAYLPYFQLFDIPSKEGIDQNENIYKLNNFLPTEEFEQEEKALDYILKNNVL